MVPGGGERENRNLCFCRAKAWVVFAGCGLIHNIAEVIWVDRDAWTLCTWPAIENSRAQTRGLKRHGKRGPHHALHRQEPSEDEVDEPHHEQWQEQPQQEKKNNRCDFHRSIRLRC